MTANQTKGELFRIWRCERRSAERHRRLPGSFGWPYADGTLWPGACNKLILLVLNGCLFQLPTLAILSADEWFGFGCVGHSQVRGIPLEFLTDAEGDIAQVIRLGQPTSILEVARRWLARLASVNPFRVMATRFG